MPLLALRALPTLRGHGWRRGAHLSAWRVVRVSVWLRRPSHQLELLAGARV